MVQDLFENSFISSSRPRDKLLKNFMLPFRVASPTVFTRIQVLPVLILTFFVLANAQDTVTGAFEGIVSDSQTGVRLRGAAVTIVNDQTGISISLRTDFRGRFFQGLLLPGIYTITISLPGYQTRAVRQRLITGQRNSNRINSG